ncbi:MAG: TonB-dependent receptor [Reichenbachiella sp.]
MNKKNITILLGIAVAIISLNAKAQSPTQVVKGKIIDAQAEYPLIGATITLIDSDPILGTVVDMEGNFRLENVPIGRQSFVVNYIGYKSITLPNVLVSLGKEVILQIKLEESVEQLDEIVITAGADKDQPINELAKVSARTFSLEEVTRFSGGRNDVARLAASFAGVSAPDDSRNDIVVRGNSPTALLWRIDGLPIATTNHYATLGTTGGPVSALNTNLLRTSDFLTGAFPAEYGNANAAVFDVNFRNGNTDKYEFTAQMSAFSGLEAMAEGPISRKNNSSFLVSYRYGIASLAATGTSAIPKYHDLSFKINLGESKLGRFEIFGLGGNSKINFYGDEIDETDLFADPNQDAYIDNNLGMVGLSHVARIGKTAFVKTVAGVSTNSNSYTQYNLMRDADGIVNNDYLATIDENTETRYAITSSFNKKFNARWNMKVGFLTEYYQSEFYGIDRHDDQDIPDDNGDGVPDYFNIYRDFQGSYYLAQFFGQAERKITDNLSFTFGLHSQYHSLTEAMSIEPRTAVSWQVTKSQRLSLAYGLHSQAVPSPILFHEEQLDENTSVQTNTSLGFMKSHHFVMGYDRRLGDSWRLKVETYYQHLFDVPVETIESSYSAINQGADFVFDVKPYLVNEGSGRNYGAEVTLEKFFSRGYYMLFTTSIYDSKYQGSDNELRNTAFNNNYVVNTLFGKEWKWGKNDQNAWTFDTKLTTSGGKPYTPIDLESTRDNGGNEVLFEDQAYSLRTSVYFRWDVKFGVRLNSRNKNISHQFYVDLQNITNRKNEFVERYNPVTDEINVIEQMGFFPDVMYRVNF